MILRQPKRSRSRPNVIPAKQTTHIFCEANNNLGRNKNGSLKAIVQDICDFCLPEKVTYIYLRRSWFRMRKFGYKFMCPACAKAYKEKSDFNGWKDAKIFIGNYSPNFSRKKK